MPKVRAGGALVRVGAAVLFLLLLIAAWQWMSANDLSGEAGALRSFVAALGSWGPLGIIVFMGLAIVVNPVPSAPIALVAGALFGHLWGTLYILIGAELGALVAFGLARYLGRDLAQRRLAGRLAPLARLDSQNSLTALVFASRLLPFISFDLVSYGAGLTSLHVWRFAIATLLGLVPMSFLLAHYGQELGAGEAGGAAGLVLLLGLVVMLPWLVRGMRRVLSGPDTQLVRRRSGDRR